VRGETAGGSDPLDVGRVREPIAVRAGVGDTADTRSQGMAVSSTVTPIADPPMTLLPSFACHVGPPKWVTMSWPLSS
jgi:hypothetical protein